MKKHTKYSAAEGIRFRRAGATLAFIATIFLFVGGLYLLLLTFSPSIQLPIFSTPRSSATQNDVDRIVIEKIDVDIPFHPGGVEALEKGAWHRYPERGNPEKGGNFILSAHRFQLGITPQQTRAKSPFYNLDKLAIGDKITIRYNNLMYQYEVEQKYDVERTAVEIEAPSEAHKLTLYSCALSGEKDGRIVIEAKQL